MITRAAFIAVLLALGVVVSTCECGYVLPDGTVCPPPGDGCTEDTDCGAGQHCTECNICATDAGPSGK